MKNIKITEQWGEGFALIFIILGFIISIFLMNDILSYITIVLAGFLAGRVYYIKHETEPTFPFILMILGFLFGYFVAGIWVSRLLILVLFILSFTLSYYLHLNHILVIFKSKNFIK